MNFEEILSIQSVTSNHWKTGNCPPHTPEFFRKDFFLKLKKTDTEVEWNWGPGVGGQGGGKRNGSSAAQSLPGPGCRLSQSRLDLASTTLTLKHHCLKLYALCIK